MLFIALVFAPTVLMLCVWTVVTTWRVLHPEQPIPFEHDPYVMRELARERGQMMAVGFREIRQDQRRHQRATLATYQYDVDDLVHQGLPPAWIEDLILRQN